MKTGDTVKFKDGLYEDEILTRYVVLEINGDRTILKYLCELPIPPQSVARTEELEVVEE